VKSVEPIVEVPEPKTLEKYLKRAPALPIVKPAKIVR